MQTGREALARYVAQNMQERGYSTYEVARRSGGFRVSNGTVWNVQKGKVKEIKENTLLGLACAFEVSAREVFAIYRGDASEAEIDELRLVEYFRALPSDKRTDVLLILEILHKQHGNTEGHTSP